MREQRVEEGDLAALGTLPGRLADRLDAVLDSRDDRAVDVGHLEGQVVQPLAVALEEPAHRGILGERFEELDLAPRKRQQRDLHALALDLFDLFDLQAQYFLVEDPGVDDRTDGYPDVGQTNGHPRLPPSVEERVDKTVRERLTLRTRGR